MGDGDVPPAAPDRAARAAPDPWALRIGLAALVLLAVLALVYLG